MCIRDSIKVLLPHILVCQYLAVVLPYKVIERVEIWLYLPVLLYLLDIQADCVL